MALVAGTKLGPYEVISPLGAGGMGEVYRARDPRLSRDVAIKVLPSSFSTDPERLSRFQQEARAAGALNHPNVLAVFDFGVHADSPYLVTELLQGETLRERLRSGPLSVRKSLDYGTQMAQGIAAAHERGIVHRDLKPENIFICADDRIKILDFGLAKLLHIDPLVSDSQDTHSIATHSGSVLGTLGYMSPEQVRGKNADARSDIFALGSVLYETLTGVRPFQGQTVADVASAILKEEPPEEPLSARRVPPALMRILHHCLEKAPEARFQSARDLAFQLQNISTISDQSPVGRQAKPSSRLRWVWVGLAGLVLLSAMGWWRSRATESLNVPAVEFRRLTDFTGLEEAPALSPDGKSIAFVSDVTGNRQIWVRLLAGGQPLQITREAGDHTEPRWSPDSGSIFYFVPPAKGQGQGTMWQIAALGGSPRRLAGSLGGPDISHDGKQLVFFRLNQNKVELVKSDLDGLNEHVIIQLPAVCRYLNPRWAPDDQTIAYQHNLAFWAFSVFTIGVSGGTPKQITREDDLMNGLAWTPDGREIVYSSGRGASLIYLPTMQLWAVPREGGNSRLITYGETSYEWPDISKDGTLVASTRQMHFDIWKFPISPDPLKNVQDAVRITHQTGRVHTPSLSPDGKEMVYISDSGGPGNVWVMNLGTGESRQITAPKSNNSPIGVPLWSPDGKRIIYAQTHNDKSWREVDYWLVNPDGSDLRKILVNGAWATWSPDSRWIYFSNVSPVRAAEDYQLFKIPAEGGPPVTVRTERAMGVAIPPNSTKLYFAIPLQSENGIQDFAIRVAETESGPARDLVQISGNRIPIWQGPHPVISPDGKWLVLPLNDTLGTNLWMISTSDGQMRRLTDFGERRTSIARRVSWSPDGKYVFASVGEADADIVQVKGLVH